MNISEGSGCCRRYMKQPQYKKQGVGEAAYSTAQRNRASCKYKMEKM